MSLPSSFPGLAGLLTLVRVVDAGSFAEAARRLGTSASAVSKSISRFEKRHGVRLLHRTTHSLSLTSEGEHVIDRARHLLREAEEIEAFVGKSASGRTRGRVRISVPGSFGRACVIPLLPAMRRRFPDIDIDLSFEDALVDLGSEGIDIAIRAGVLEKHPGLIATELFRFNYILCATPSYLLDRPLPETPNDLSRHEHVSFRNRGTGKLQNWQFSTPGNREAIIRIRPNVHTVVDDGGMAWHLMREGLGVAWAPTWLGLEDLRKGSVVEMLPEWRMPSFPIWAVRLNRRQTPIRTREILTFLQEQCAHLGGS